MITFNGIDLSNKISVTSIGGRGPLTQNIIRTSISGKDGSYPQRRVLPERSITISFELVGDSLEDIRQKVDNLSLVFNVELDVPIQFLDEPGKNYYGQLDGHPDWDEILYIGKGKITLLCCDPCKYGPETKSDFVNDTTYPNVDGTYKTYPRIEATFTAAATEFKVLHSQQNKYVRVIRNFVAGDRIIIDFATGKITLNGSVTMLILDWMNSDLFALSPGSQTLNVTPISKATTKIFWKPRWL